MKDKLILINFKEMAYFRRLKKWHVGWIDRTCNLNLVDFAAGDRFSSDNFNPNHLFVILTKWFCASNQSLTTVLSNHETASFLTVI